ncbi:glycine cleavage system aminomethyltransferase GcvT [Conexibacter arvalis]|uniref:aminomethyltransferase n=1 Tax=Conexibacter arvalis TaxID=912552 RepID=A0A840I8E1_9ACTN|nr:glycine cleavage system aminomethyltransferase GcvT [Conexibacter arvalis]MBB4660541.1 aminomethyltransferase [Conexibacter arvalis]
MRATPLHDRHIAADAKLVPYAGWEMPLHYASGVKAEHLAVRDGVGVFDVSHMGEIATRGPRALEFLQRILSNDVATLSVGGAQYSVLCRADGGVLDDLFTYRLADDVFLTVTNAANHAKDLAWFRRQAEAFDGVEVVDRADDHAMLAVQGPAARALVSGLLSAGQELPRRFRTAHLTVAGVQALVCGTGYTGEDGVELLVAPDDATVLWDAIVGAGAAPVGLAARDTLRLEVCFHLYGNDLTESRGPIEAGLGWCCKEETGFIGSEAVAATRADGPAERLVPFAIDGPGIARPGNAVDGGGVVTSGTHSPSLGVGIGMAYLPAARARVGERIAIDVRGRTRTAVVVEKPIYRPKER